MRTSFRWLEKRAISISTIEKELAWAAMEAGGACGGELYMFVCTAYCWFYCVWLQIGCALRLTPTQTQRTGSKWRKVCVSRFVSAGASDMDRCVFCAYQPALPADMCNGYAHICASSENRVVSSKKTNSKKNRGDPSRTIKGIQPNVQIINAYGQMYEWWRNKAKDVNDKYIRPNVQMIKQYGLIYECYMTYGQLCEW